MFAGVLKTMSFRPLLQICRQQVMRVEESLHAAGILSAGKQLQDFMHAYKLADLHEDVYAVFERATQFLAESGSRYTGPERVAHYQQQFMENVCRFEVILGSPILTNAGRRGIKSISACSIPPVKLSCMTREQIANIVSDYHTRGMGTGFSLDELEDPVSMVIYLNALAISEVQKGKIERSCGNMGVLSIDHPQVLSFIRVKTDHPDIKEWKFNLSVNITERFMHALAKKEPFTLKNGTQVDPEELMQQIAHCAHGSGDPGLIFMDRINRLNRLPQAGQYKTVVPCGEVSLFEGEVCQFCYINLPRFLEGERVNRDALRQAIHTSVVLLDNAVEANIIRMPYEQSATIVGQVRRIGLGVCGFAEILQALGLPYSSPEARELAEDLMSFINFESKRASIELSIERGPFPLFDHTLTRKDLFLTPFRERPTRWVSEADWRDLERQFEAYKIRHLATTILPPSGRSSIMAGVTASIEPPFRLVPDSFFKEMLSRHARAHGYAGNLEEVMQQAQTLGSVQNSVLPQAVKEIFKTALELAPHDHLLMTAAFQRHIDEGISKTVNLPEEAGVEDVKTVYYSAYQLNLKGITIYRNSSRMLQPKALKQTENLMVVVDPIYGPLSLSPRLAKILQSPLFTRLKGVHQNGSAYLVDPRQSTSRYEHSVGVMALAKMLTDDESVHVMALLHDISHTAFSHLADLVFGCENQDYHTIMRDHFLQSKQAKKMIEDCSVTQQELAVEKNLIVKGKNINSDRLDYAIRDLKATNRIFHPEYASIINQLVLNNEGEIYCKDIATARLLFNKFLEANQCIYFDPKAEVAALVMAAILKKMYERGELTLSDFFTTDEAVIEKIKQSDLKDTFEGITPQMTYSPSPTPTPYPGILRKLRFIDPNVAGMSGTLTEHCDESRAKLQTYLKTPTVVYYNTPLLYRLLCIA